MKKKWLVMVPVLALLMTTLAACGSGDKAGSNGTGANGEGGQTSEVNQLVKDPFGKYEEPVTVNIGKLINTQGINLPDGDTVEDNQFTRYVESRVNVKIKHEWQVERPDSYQQKLGVIMAGRDLPDAFIVNEQQLKQLVEADLIEDLTSIYETTISDTIKKFYDSYDGRVLSRATFDGKLMAFPSTNIGGEHSITWLRKDWLDNLNLEVPQTLDELLNVARAFIEQDPDKNGQKDTYGFSGVPEIAKYNMIHGFDPILGVFGAYKGQWVAGEDGSAVYSSVQPQMKEALAKLQEMYKDGLIDKEFAVRKDPNELVASGRAGIVFGPWWTSYSPMFPDSFASDSKVEWLPVTAPLDENGKLKVHRQDPTGDFLVIRKGFEHPEAIAKALNVQTEGLRMLDPEATKLYDGKKMPWHLWPFTLQLNDEDNIYQINQQLVEAWDKKDPSILNDEYKLMYDKVKRNMENPKKDMNDWVETLARFVASKEAGSENLHKEDVVFFGQTDAMELKWAVLKKMEDEAFLKIIMGEEPIERFDSFVTEWNKAGGEQITKEVNEELASK
ncbi:extracellular solute-binding protein [Paenibacillus yanchengensis]|uniref:Extracellular solute-binding protein n=1 Tax=Paenibacillus yanchengensis TaxID=2035833 RepID=A0ABW4YGI0_9BACL